MKSQREWDAWVYLERITFYALLTFSEDPCNMSSLQAIFKTKILFRQQKIFFIENFSNLFEYLKVFLCTEKKKEFSMFSTSIGKPYIPWPNKPSKLGLFYF